MLYRYGCACAAVHVLLLYMCCSAAHHAPHCCTTLLCAGAAVITIVSFRLRMRMLWCVVHVLRNAVGCCAYTAAVHIRIRVLLDSCAVAYASALLFTCTCTAVHVHVLLVQLLRGCVHYARAACAFLPLLCRFTAVRILLNCAFLRNINDVLLILSMHMLRLHMRNYVNC